MSNENRPLSQPIFVGPSEVRRSQLLAQPGGPADVNALVSIVMPCCGQLEHTRLSVPRLLRHSRAPFELIFVEVGSLDGTSEYLDGVAAAAPVRVEVVRAAEAAFAQAVREGLARAQGTFVAWVNNDVLVPAGWLEHLVGLATSNPVIGMVGPMANVAPAPQRLAVPYRLRRRPAGQGAEEAPGAEGTIDMGAVDRFSEEHGARHQREWFEAERLGGFCFLLKREALATAPLLEPEAEDGVFDADGLSVRLRRAGYRLAVCRDLFVHHFGSRISIS
jgi:GT2 family glycosyltransferase